jgi:hypothetical protein
MKHIFSSTPAEIMICVSDFMIPKLTSSVSSLSAIYQPAYLFQAIARKALSPITTTPLVNLSARHQWWTGTAGQILVP